MAKHAKHAADADLLEQQDPVDSQEESLDEHAEAKAKAGAHAKGNVPQDIQEPILVTPEAVSSGNKDHIPAHQKKSKRMRVVLTVVSVILVLLLAGLGYFAWNLMSEANDVASQAATQTQQSADDAQAAVSDASSVSADLDSAPSLVSLLGLSKKEAVALLGQDAKITNEKDITKEKTVKRKNGKTKKKTVVVGKDVTVALGDSSSKSGAPTVYLTLNKNGKVSQAGFSASMDALGFGSVSFSDAVKEQHVVEHVVSGAGIPLEDGSVELPDAKKYRTYAQDGKTIAQEQYTFKGKGKATTGTVHAWSCRLNYDYSAANVSGNLADTIRQIYVYVECVGRS